MHVLYDSESFSVTHMMAASLAGVDVRADGVALAAPIQVRHGFEIVDKRSGKELYLDGSWAELFKQHLQAWQLTMPTQAEVEETLGQYAELAQTPVLLH